MSLRVEIYAIEEDVQEDGKVYIEYLLRTTYACTSHGVYKTWELKRRFSKFFQLHQDLKSLERYGDLIASLQFPSRAPLKNLFESKLSIAVTRRPMLCEYIQSITALGPPYAASHVEFLNLGPFLFSGGKILPTKSIGSSSNDGDAVEMRGVKLALLQAVRDLALKRNSDRSYWSFERVSALIVGNNEILSAHCRFGDKIDPRTTLTFINGKCASSLIEMLKRDHPDASKSKHPELKLSYDLVVGAQANIFLSFAYNDNFFELVDAMEQLSNKDPANFNIDSTFYWFDMFVNNQWLAGEKSSHWWTTLFRDTVRKIGSTICFMSSWNDPNLVGKAWCLYEMSCSERLMIVVSTSQIEEFQRILRRETNSIMDFFSNIDLEKATCRKEEDRLQIFAAVRSTPGGFFGFNNKVIGLIRDWVNTSKRAIVEAHE